RRRPPPLSVGAGGLWPMGKPLRLGLASQADYPRAAVSSASPHVVLARHLDRIGSPWTGDLCSRRPPRGVVPRTKARAAPHPSRRLASRDFHSWAVLLLDPRTGRPPDLEVHGHQGSRNG